MSLLLQVRQCAHAPSAFTAIQFNADESIAYVAQLCETCEQTRRKVLDDATMQGGTRPRIDEILELQIATHGN